MLFNAQLSEPALDLVTEEIIDHYVQMCLGNCNPNDLQQRARQAGLVDRLQRLQPQQICDRTMVDPQAADCCVAGIKLLHGQLGPSHDISQAIKTREGSYWHGIMHRLEGDYWNSKYWFGNVGQHPVVRDLQAEFAGYPEDFIDRCEVVVESGQRTDDEELQSISRQEWVSLFEYCLQRGFDQ